MNTKHTLQYAEEPNLEDLFEVKKFNDWMAQVRSVSVSKLLFGQLWIEGEIAVLTGDPGVGKSLLAVQIAEGIARGKGCANDLTQKSVILTGEFACTTEPQKVLYVNLKQSSKQFAGRYAEEHDSVDGHTLRNLYQFSPNLNRVDLDIHVKLPKGYKTFDKILPPLVERLAKKHEAKVVVIDSITYLQSSVYGYRETYAMMKGLHRIKSKRGISILVLARTSKYGSVRESSAGSNSALFSRFADSVFMLGQSKLDPSMRYLKQLIVHSSEKLYDESHVASFVISRLNGNFLGLEHYGFNKEIEHHQPMPDNRIWPLIDKVKTLSDEGKTIREIAEKIGVPRSTVHRYLQTWTEEIGAEVRKVTRTAEPYDPKKDKEYFPGREEYDEAKNDPKFKLLMDTSISDDDPQFLTLMREYGIIDNACHRASQEYKKTGVAPKLCEDQQYAEFIKIVAEGGNPFAYDQKQQTTDEAVQETDQRRHLDDDADPVTKARNSCKCSKEAWSRAAASGETFPNLEYALNDHGSDTWVEKRDERGKPILWYTFNSKGRKQRYTRTSSGIGIETQSGPLIE